ncbi:MAG: hypothetical protein F6K00_31510 [Leptolyngbya sp. SIOISBB]|nr:hypothetical protein [Leptolyngbya sp. SIOISBB]
MKHTCTLNINNIPFEDYQEGIINIESSSQISGNITIGSKEYQVNSRGASLAIDLEENPIGQGDYVSGVISGVVSDGINSENISIDFTVSVSKEFSQLKSLKEPLERVTLNQGIVYREEIGNNAPTIAISGNTLSDFNNGPRSLSIGNIPISEYESGLIRAGKSHSATGSIEIIDSSGNFIYDLLEPEIVIEVATKNTPDGSFMEGVVHGTISDGIETREVIVDLFLPIETY